MRYSLIVVVTASVYQLTSSTISQPENPSTPLRTKHTNSRAVEKSSILLEQNAVTGSGTGNLLKRVQQTEIPAQTLLTLSPSTIIDPENAKRPLQPTDAKKLIALLDKLLEPHQQTKLPSQTPFTLSPSSRIDTKNTKLPHQHTNAKKMISLLDKLLEHHKQTKLRTQTPLTLSPSAIIYTKNTKLPHQPTEYKQSISLLDKVKTQGVGSLLAPHTHHQSSAGRKTFLEQIVPRLDMITSQEDLNELQLKVQKESDKQLLPLVSYWFEKKEVVPFDVFHKVFVDIKYPPIYKQGKTAVYNIDGYDNYVIKYYTFCYDSVDTFDPVVIEATLMKLLEPLSICPKILHISAPTTVFKSHIQENDLGKVEQTTCDEDNGQGGYNGPIRYMIMEKVGRSVNQIMKESPGGRLPFRRAIEYGIQMIELLEKLHSHNIIHGDAHIGNFATIRNDENRLILIDFGRARYAGPREIAKAYNRKDFCTGSDWIHPFTGKWEMRECKPAFRDDVYRAVQMTAMAMHGSRHFEYLYSLSQWNLREYKRIKNSGDFFNLPEMRFKVKGGPEEVLPELSLRDRVGRIHQSKFDQIIDHLNRVSAEAVRENMIDPYEKPNYRQIIKEFKGILDNLK
jgi:hypothetical protein